MRTGLIFEKIGMTRLFTEDGQQVPVTLLCSQGCQVVSHRNQETHGYTALQLGIGNAKPKNVSKAMKGYFSKHNIDPKRKLVEFRVSEDALIDIGESLSVEHFKQGQFVDVTSISIGKGFAGGMKRHNFGGSRASHGVSLSHRSLGSTGQRQDPGKVFKGKKMAGHMGCRKVTTQNLKVVMLDPAKNLLVVKGCVPGASGAIVCVRDAIKKQQSDLPTPGVVLDSSGSKNQETKSEA